MVMGVRKMGANLVMRSWISGMGWGGFGHGFGLLVGWREKWKREDVEDVEPLCNIILI